MNLLIAYSQKEAAKYDFRAAGIPLTWNSAAKVWQTTAASLPSSLLKYTTRRTDAERPTYRPGKPQSEAEIYRILSMETGQSIEELKQEDAECKARLDAEAALFLKNERYAEPAS